MNDTYFFMAMRRRTDHLVTLHSDPTCGGIKEAMKVRPMEQVLRGSAEFAQTFGPGALPRLCRQNRCKTARR